jgi:aspartate 1-decarboxylase
MMKSKIHRATVTEASLEYEGSLTIDRNLLEAADLLPYEKVDVYNINNGERFSTYVIEGEPGAGVICLNGAAARKGAVGDLLIIVSFVWIDDSECKGHKGRNIFVDQANSIKKVA